MPPIRPPRTDRDDATAPPSSPSGAGLPIARRLRRLSRRPAAVYGVLAAAALAAVLFGLNSVYGFFGGASAASGPLRTATVTTGIVQSTVSASGNVSAATSAAADFGTSGTLTAVNVQVGDHVKAGQVLARLDDTTEQAGVQTAQANLAQAESALAGASAGPTDAQKASNAASLLQSESQLASAREQLASNEQTLADAQKQLAADKALACPATGSASAAAGPTSSSASAASSGGAGSGGSGAAAGAAPGSASSGSSSAAANGAASSSGPSGSAASTGSSGGPRSTAPATFNAAAALAAATPPAATTGQASGVTATGATLDGSVNPGGLDTDYWFQYGLTPALDRGTPSQGAGSGNGPVPVSADLTGLQPATTYYFRVVAQNGNGRTNGAEATFTTAAAGTPVATTAAAGSVTMTSATLAGTVDPNSIDTTYSFQYGTSKAFGSTTPTVDAGSGAAPAQVSAVVTGLEPGTTYVFRLVATNSFGTSEGVTQYFTTSTAGAAVTGQASGVTTTGATLTGTVNPQGAGTSYRFDYGATKALGRRTRTMSAGAGNGPVSVSLDVTGLESGTTYHFKLVATNVNGTAEGAEETLKTPPAAAPAAATGSATSVGGTSVTLTGTVNPNATDTRYHFEYGPSGSFSSRTATVDAGSGTTDTQVSAPIEKLEPGRSYSFRLVATNSFGATHGITQTVMTAAPASAPTATTGSASSVGGRSMTLSGTVNPNASDTHYYFEYGPSSPLAFKTAVVDAGAGTTAAQVSAVIANLKPGTTYAFRLLATNAFGTTHGITQVVSTASSSCVADASTIESAKLAAQQQQAAVKSAEASLAQTNATIASTGTSAATLAQDEAAVVQARATLASDRKALAATVLTAPVSGTVTAVSASVGDTVGGSGSSVTRGGAANASANSAAGAQGGGGGAAGSSSSSSSGLITIETLDELQVVSGFPEADATKLAVGQPATVTFPALPDTEVAGRVTAISSTSTVVSNVVTYDATIALIDPPAEVKDGMTVNADVVVDTRRHVLELPSSAITTNGAVSTVELLQNGKASVTRIQTGLVGGSSTQIVSGLKAGDVVALPTVTVSSTASTSSPGGAFGGGAGGFGGGGGGGFGGRAFGALRGGG